MAGLPLTTCKESSSSLQNFPESLGKGQMMVRLVKLAELFNTGRFWCPRGVGRGHQRLLRGVVLGRQPLNQTRKFERGLFEREPLLPSSIDESLHGFGEGPATGFVSRSGSGALGVSTPGGLHPQTLPRATLPSQGHKSLLDAEVSLPWRRAIGQPVRSGPWP
jgi:hypothetical protein